MYDMLYKTFDHLGIDEFRKKVSSQGLRQLLAEEGVVEVGAYHQADAFLVEPGVFADLSEKEERLESLMTTIPLLMAAVSTRTAIPSEMLKRFGMSPGDDSWQALNALQAAFPVRFTGNEDGGPLTRASFSTQTPIGELDEELDLIDD
jgi:hypothetical protein